MRKTFIFILVVLLLTLCGCMASNVFQEEQGERESAVSLEVTFDCEDIFGFHWDCGEQDGLGSSGEITNADGSALKRGDKYIIGLYNTDDSEGADNSVFYVKFFVFGRDSKQYPAGEAFRPTDGEKLVVFGSLEDGFAIAKK